MERAVTDNTGNIQCADGEAVHNTIVPPKGKYELQRHEVAGIIVGNDHENRDITTK